MINKQMSTIIHHLWWLLVSLTTIEAMAVDMSDEPSWQQLIEQCNNYERTVQTLDSYLEFQMNYDRLNKCLHSNEPPTACLDAEQKCRQNGLPYTGVKILGQLVYKAAAGEPICNIEFASKIYRLHRQVEGNNGGWPKLARHLRALANRWANRCRASLANRLSSVERRAPDARKHVTLIANILNIGGMDEVAKLPLEPEYYVPILDEDRALDERVSSAGGFGASGYRFENSIQIDTAMQMLKMSCHALKLYHVNMLGSIGLLASVGYAAPRPLDKEPEDVRGQMRRWLASALLCQILRGVVKMSSVDANGEDQDEILVLSLQEADLSPDDERDTDFASFGLPEAIGGHMEMDLEGLKPADLYVYKESIKLNIRRLELINGPSRILASAIYTYLDLRQKNRMPMATTIMSLS